MDRVISQLCNQYAISQAEFLAIVDDGCCSVPDRKENSSLRSAPACLFNYEGWIRISYALLPMFLEIHVGQTKTVLAVVL